MTERKKKPYLATDTVEGVQAHIEDALFLAGQPGWRDGLTELDIRVISRVFHDELERRKYRKRLYMKGAKR